MAGDDITMQAVWFEAGSARVRDDVEAPRPQAGDALVRVSLAGICGTDLQLLAGYASFRGIPGHEFVGEVVSGDKFRVGTRVVGEINVGCEACARCASGMRAHCERRRVLGIRHLDGAFATFVRLPETNLHEVPAAISDAAAVFAEPLAAACRIAEQLGELRGQRILLLGAGRLGQLVARVLLANGGELTVATSSDRKRRLLPHGAATVDPAKMPARHFDIAVDCTGDAAGAEAARRTVRPQGTLVIKSTHAGTSHLDLNAVVVDELSVVGSRCGPFPAALQLLASGAVDPLPLVDATLPLRDAVAALAAARAPGALKILLRP